MKGIRINPYALYVWVDAGMDYDSKNTGGVGLHFMFPDDIDLEEIKKSVGHYEGANIERLELEAILQGMNEFILLFKTEEKLKDLKTIIFMTDRYGLNDNDKTSPYRIRQWRKDKWYNYEGKPIKNSDLLEKIDKTRTKITKLIYGVVEINYGRRKLNKVPDKLATAAKKKGLVKSGIALNGLKICRRKYDGDEIDYKLIEKSTELKVRVFKKEPIKNQWEIWVEVYEGEFIKHKLKLYVDFKIEKKLHRHHQYNIRIKKVFTHHIIIYRTIKEIKDVKK